jgi:hypothetical protein
LQATPGRRAGTRFESVGTRWSAAAIAAEPDEREQHFVAVFLSFSV